MRKACRTLLILTWIAAAVDGAAAQTIVVRAGVDGDPLADVSLLEDVKFVMKGGEIYKAP